jgi:hypothetical protein
VVEAAVTNPYLLTRDEWAQRRGQPGFSAWLKTEDAKTTLAGLPYMPALCKAGCLLPGLQQRYCQHNCPSVLQVISELEKEDS